MDLAERPSNLESGLYRMPEISGQIKCQLWEYALEEFITLSMQLALEKTCTTIYALRD